MGTFSNHDDFINSQDIITRVEELQAALDNEDVPAGHRLTGVEIEEFQILTALASEGADYLPDWQYGETLIRDSYFVEYVKELLVDVGYIPRDFPAWIKVDWEATAEQVQMDYTEFDFGGVTYWGR